MPILSAYLKDLSERRGLRRSPDGSTVRYRLRLDGRADITLVIDELDTTQPAWVMSEPWPMPTVEAARAPFMRAALDFNRNALHHLHAGIRLDPGDGSQFRLVWRVEQEDLPSSEWSARLKLFGRLTDKAWETLPRPGSRAARKAPSSDDEQVIFMP